MLGHSSRARARKLLARSEPGADEVLLLEDSRFASAIAQESGWPPNVIPCVNAVFFSAKKGSIVRSLAMRAPSGAYAEVIPLATVIMSGSIP